MGKVPAVGQFGVNRFFRRRDQVQPATVTRPSAPCCCVLLRLSCHAAKEEETHKEDNGDDKEGHNDE